MTAGHHLKHIIVEGLDRIGKSTLIEGLQQELGYFTVIHYSKPKVLKACMRSSELNPRFVYQQASFNSMFKLLNGDAPIMLDRAHLGESVYAKRYRGYDGDYVFDMENVKNAEALEKTLLILLVNDDRCLESALVDDGDSFDWTKRDEEQKDFKAAFERSRFANKLMINVGFGSRNPWLGKFFDKDEILLEAVAAFKNGTDGTRYVNA